MRIGISSYGSGYWYQDLDYVDDHFELNDYKIPSVDCADDVCIKTTTISASAAIDWVKAYNQEPYLSQALQKIDSIINGDNPNAAKPQAAKPVQPSPAPERSAASEKAELVFKPEDTIGAFKTRVEKLKIMKEAGFLSEEELESEKQKLLDIVHHVDSLFFGE